MTLTPTIINSTLSLKTTFTVGNTGTPPPDTLIISDESIWGNIVSSSTDIVNIILQILDPAGQPIYQNTGWNSSVFTSPDLFYGASPITQTTAKTLFYDQNGNLITGNFTVNAKVQVVQDWATTPITTYGNGQSLPLLNSAYLQKNLGCTLLFQPDYFHANMTVSDQTVYGAYTSITPLITVTPPIEAHQSVFTATANSVLVTGLWAPAPYQGLINNIVYYNTNTLTATISYINYYQNYDTLNTIDLCPLYCCMKELWDKCNRYNGHNQNEYDRWNHRFQRGASLIYLCQQALECSDTEAIKGYIAQFYQVTQCDCNCGCTNTPSPVVPVVPTQGPPGNNGISVVSATIINGYLIITLSNNTTINAGQIPAGTNGSNGTSLIWTPNLNPPFTANSASSPNFYSPGSIPIDAFVSEGDTVRINCLVNNPRNNGSGGYVQFLVNGVAITALQLNEQSINTYLYYAELAITLHSQSTGLWELQVRGWATYYTGSSAATFFEGATAIPVVQNITGYTPSTAVPFTVDFSNCVTNATVSFIEGLEEKIGNGSAPTFSIVYTTANGSSSQVFTDIIGIPLTQFTLFCDNVPQFPSGVTPVDYTYVQSTGTVTWTGTPPPSGTRIMIQPV